jgi:Mrp family chromosome partitioning ATPase
MREVLEQLQQEADLVVLDAPPLEATVDSSILAAETDGVLLVLSAGRTRRGQVEQAIRLVTQVGGAVLGAVIYGATSVRRGKQPGYLYPARKPATGVPPTGEALAVHTNGADKAAKPVPANSGFPVRPARNPFRRA